MGSATSIFRNEENSRAPRTESVSSNFIKCPVKSGNFFSDYFILGGERFDSHQQESYLFGDNGDLNFIGGKAVPGYLFKPFWLLRSIGMKSLVLLLIVAALVPSAASASIFDDEFPALYNASDKLVILSKDNFYPKVLNDTEHVWLVEFYSSWCGHCQYFAPIFKEFAKRVQPWSKLVKIGAIDCANENNTEICRDYDIMGYPTMRVIHTNATKRTLGEDVKGSRDVQGLVESLVLYLAAQQNIGNASSTWPNIQPVTAKNIAELLRLSNTSKTVVIVTGDIVEAQKIILDACGVPEMPPILCVPQTNLNLLKALNASTAPSVFEISKTGAVLPLNISSKDYKNILKELQKRYIGDTDLISVVSEKIKESKTEETTSIYPLKPLTPDVTYLIDIEKGLKYLLEHEVALLRVVTGEKLEALKNFMLVLNKYFPARKRVGEYLEIVMNYINKHADGFKGEEFGEKLKLYEQKYTPEWKNLEWKGCKGSRPVYRGYPCSLWTMFHTLSVSSYLDPHSKEPLEVLKAIKDYVKYFFGCRECATHFLKVVNETLSQVKTKEDAVLWLWKAHNKANIRLSKDVSEDPKYPKIEFPSRIKCPLCRVDNKWNEKEVVNYLVELYRRENLSFEGLNDSKRVFYNGISNRQERELLEVGEGLRERWKIKRYSKPSKLPNRFVFERKEYFMKPEPETNSAISFFDLLFYVCFYAFGAFCFLFFVVRVLLRKQYRRKLYFYDEYGKI
ncbi:sulfhydryl oxidase 2-like isoform X1 [Artemia franciscana]|uniref:sulfhydryl oxidase 2-like isoform X1 n=2 Tax=Artemia franciscana TaxID=6661 RepID=UPI0032DA5FFC